MPQRFILASGSSIRSQLLQQACVPHEVSVARIDEQMIKMALLAEQAPPRDIADTLSNPATPDEAIAQLKSLRGDRHSLLSAAVIVEDGKPIWRHVGQVRLRMRDASDSYIEEYVARNWDSIQHAVGAYKLEEEGVRLFSGIEGDYFNVLGLPLLELLNYLTLRGDLSA